MIARVVTKFVANMWLAIALLHAQKLSDAERKFFERADDALGVHLGAVIADIGTGSTFMHPLRIAEKVGTSGKVICVDVRSEAIANIKEQAESHHLTNIEAILGKEDDPLLTAETFDGILVSHTYHEFTQPSAMLRHMYDALKTGGGLVVLEFYSKTDRSESRADQARWHHMSPDILERELSTAGFVIKERIQAVPPNGGAVQYFIRAEKSK